VLNTQEDVSFGYSSFLFLGILAMSDNVDIVT